MFTTEAITGEERDPGIVIDCSRLEAASSAEHPMEMMLAWVRSVSGSAPVHVYIRSQLSGQLPRKYQALLQSVGCVVTTRVHC